MFIMKKGLVGVQMMMLKKKVDEMGVYEVFRKLSEMGFHCVEVSQIPMTPENVAEMKRGCADFGIKVAALSAGVEPMPGMPGESLQTDFDKIVADCKELNCNFLRVGMLPFHYMSSKEGAMTFVGKMEELAGRLAEHNIELYYHNHHCEFRKYDGEYLLDIIKNNTSHIGFELDVHWIQRGGENPITFVKKYTDRVKLLHLKDFRTGEFVMPEVKGPEDFMKVMENFGKITEFAELGQGSLPMKEIVEAGLEAGSEYFLIEQDDTYGRDPFESLEMSRDHLYSLGFKDMFSL